MLWPHVALPERNQGCASDMAARSEAQGAHIACEHNRDFRRARVGARLVAALNPGRARLAGFGFAPEFDREYQREAMARRVRHLPVARFERAHAGQRDIEKIGRGLEVTRARAKVIRNRCARLGRFAGQVLGEQRLVFGKGMVDAVRPGSARVAG